MGQFCHKAVINAISIGSQIMHMVNVIILGLAMGLTVLISQAVGTGKQRKPQVTQEFIWRCFAGIIFITAYNIISCIFRGMGESLADAGVLYRHCLHLQYPFRCAVYGLPPYGSCGSSPWNRDFPDVQCSLRTARPAVYAAETIYWHKNSTCQAQSGFRKRFIRRAAKQSAVPGGSS